MQTHNFQGHARRRPTWRLALPFLLVTVVLGPSLTPTFPGAMAASKHTDKREVEARKAFAAGKYQEALELFTDLYAAKPHPTYLRNVGRCYQNLKQPEKAINAFRDYLRQAKDLKDAERNEVNGFIAEMEALQRQQKDQAAAAAVPPPASPPPTSPAVPVVPPVAPEELKTTRTVDLTTQPAAQPELSTPFYKKAWFWGVVGVVVAGAVVGGMWAGGVFAKSSKFSCKVEDNCFE